MVLNPITHQSAMEFTMSQSARSMMPNQSMSTLIRAFAIISACGLATPALGAGPTQGSRPFSEPNTDGPENLPIALPKNLEQLREQPVQSGQILVYVNSTHTFLTELGLLNQTYPGISYVRAINEDLGVHELSAPSAEIAEAAYNDLFSMHTVNFVRLDWEPLDEMSEVRALKLKSRTARSHNRGRTTNRPEKLWPGVVPYQDDQTEDSRGVTLDPLQNSQWHFINNNGPTVAGRHNNIPDSIYTSQGVFGNGINIGLANQGFNTHLDTDHTELDGPYNPDLSMTFQPDRLPDDLSITAIAGTIAGEIDGTGVMGIAPGVRIGTFNWPIIPASIPLQEYNAFSWLTPQIDIKVFDAGFYYEDAVAAYNRNSIDSYVPVPFRNSFSFGRDRKGTINIFGTGTNPNAPLDILNLLAPAWPDPYNFPPAPNATWSPLDELFNTGNSSGTTLTNDWITGPFYANGQVANYPPANDRRAFVFQSVGEDGYADIYAAQGPAVFASFYAGTTNRTQATPAGAPNPPTNLLTTVPGASNVGFFPANTDAFPNTNETMSGAAIGASVIALMLEINPNLSIRDIQHILFESIQESDREGDGNDAWKWPNYDNSRFYLSNDGQTGNSFWQLNSAFYTGGPITEPQSILHSDLYGFGMVDVEIALQKAANWQRVPALIRLDTGLVGIDSEDDTEVNVEIPDAQFIQLQDADGETGTDGISLLVTGSNSLPTICIRQNIIIEAITVELTIEGDGNEDLFITLTSPHGTSSILKLPSTNNLFGTTLSEPGDPQDDDFDAAGEVNIGGTNYALYRHSFLTWKHWGELSGGEWNISITDFGPDEAQEEGEEPETGTDPTPGADNVVLFGAFGVPGSEFRSEKTVTGYRVEVFGTDSGLPIFEGCNPFATSCPADMDGNGIIDYRDLQIYVYYFTEGNTIADVDQDGDIDFADLLAFRNIWRPGFCNGGQFGNGRPRPGDTNAGGDNNPSTRPI